MEPQAIFVMNKSDWEKIQKLLEDGTQAHGDEFYGPILDKLHDALQEIT